MSKVGDYYLDYQDYQDCLDSLDSDKYLDYILSTQEEIALDDLLLRQLNR